MATSNDAHDFAAKETRVGWPRPTRPSAPVVPEPLDRRTTRIDVTMPGAAAVRLGPGMVVPGTSYRLEGWIGDGAMGIVYRAKHVELERTVALKILRPEASGSHRLAEMIRQEAKNASRIGSQFIVEVYDLGELSDGRVWFTMPLLQGESLRDLVLQGPLESGRAIGILRQVAKGLAAAHDHDIIHRDVKPENVMLVRDRGRADAVRMLDWGVAALRGDAERGLSVVAGTPYYIAPELLLNLPYDHRVDIYSFGCMAFELLTGRPPFVGETLDDLMAAHINDGPPAMDSVADVRVPASVERVIQACLTKHPQSRITSAVELEARLCEAQVEAKLESTWDDLPLPDVDDERRARLARDMPDPRGSIPRPRRWWLGVAAVALAGALAWGLRPSNASEDVVDRIEALTRQAHESAARNLFVYPPFADREEATAYDNVRELETLHESEARDRALALRHEFATTLVALGDRYWDHPGGRTFALDYYAEALVFDPEHEHARSRVGVSPGELADLRTKAADRSFSDAELSAVEPLVALAQEDPQERARQLEALRRSTTLRASTAARLEEVAESDPEVSTIRRPRLAAGSSRGGLDTGFAPDLGTTPGEAAGSTDGSDEASGHDAVSGDDAAATLPRGPQRDPAAAAALVARADAAFRAGSLDRAESLYEAALSADDRSAAAHAGLGRIAFHRGRYAAAADHGQRAVRRAPRSGKYRIDLGDAYYKAYRYAEAIEQYRRAVELGQAGAQARLDKAKAKAR